MIADSFPIIEGTYVRQISCFAVMNENRKLRSTFVAGRIVGITAVYGITMH